MTEKLYKIFFKKHNLLSLLLLGTMGLIATSCINDFELPEQTYNGPIPESNYITISLRCSRNTTRAEEPGRDDLNENKITSVTLCLSPFAGDRTHEDEPAYMQTFTELNAKNEVILRVPLSRELVNRLFGENSSNKCYAFAAVNIDPGTAKTVADLRNLTVYSDFDSKQKQEKFTMDGEGEVSYTPAANFAVGTINVKRSAAKITLALDVDGNVTEEINGETFTWISKPEGMRVRMIQGVKISNLDPHPELNMAEDVYFNSKDELSYEFDKVDRDEDDPYARYNLEQKVPFYTYPNKWSDSFDEKHGSFMILSVPWSNDGGTSWRTCYYHVPVVPSGSYETVRNISYHINLHVGILGSFVPDEPLEIDADYYVADWGQESIDVDINDYRYLVVDQNDYVVNNQNSTSIQFYTSHETEVIDVKMTFYRYNYSDQGSEFAVTVSPDQNKLSKDMGGEPVYECVFDNKNNTLILTHILDIWEPYHNNNGVGKPVSLTTRVNGTRAPIDNPADIANTLAYIDYFVRKRNDSEYSRIEFEITVQHSDVKDGSSGIDKNLYKETIIIHQYPGMYITAVQNFADYLVGTATANGALGNTQINKNYSATTNYSVIYHPEFWKDETYKGTPYPAIRPEGITADNWNKWPQQSKNDFLIGFNSYNWSYSLGMTRSTTGSSGNWNPNMYLVTVTQLKQGTDYVLGDPRSYYINNFLDDNNVNGENKTTWNGDYYYWNKSTGGGPETSGYFPLDVRGQKNPLNRQCPVNADYWTKFEVPGFTTAEAVGETSERQLKYYYPTREDESSKNVIAPKFRVCSTYGGSSPYMTRTMSRRRAAAYQEMGYCAGRWRLPTYAEVRYMIDLTNEEKIPRLFGGTGTSAWNYWCAQGAVHIPGLKDTTGKVYLDENPEWGGSDPNTMPNNDPQYGGLFTGNNYRDHTRFVYDEWYWGSETIEPTSAKPNDSKPIYKFMWGDRLKSNPQPQE